MNWTDDLEAAMPTVQKAQDTRARWHAVLKNALQRDDERGRVLTENQFRETATEIAKLTEFVGEKLSSVPEVRCVFADSRNGAFYIWIVVERWAEGVRKRVHDRERVIIDAFPSLEFDFCYVETVRPGITDLFPDSAQLIYER